PPAPSAFSPLSLHDALLISLRTLWTYRQAAAVNRFFTRWYGWAIRSRLEPVKQVAATLKRHLDGVLRFVKHPITNGVAEGLNSKDRKSTRLNSSHQIISYAV